ncbi:16S rRNA (cytosine(1402)-N(4))-methyltransferase RsmH [Patescibacteria group bacterium]|nr:16S rRNA (cytosine(1402)-N(4))-methyltransferase RsmH [Patescibacteria group bacterium]
MSIHKPVLLKEVIENLNLKEGTVAVDATLGGGGHSRAILEKIGKKGRLITIDWDGKALESFQKSLLIGQSKVINLVQDNFAGLNNILGGLQIKKATAILADLGFSSDQLEDSSRGLSFQKDGPLDMRLDSKGDVSAWEIVNQYPLKDLEKIIRELGEERFAGRIARKIVEVRKKKRILTAGELVALIESAVPKRYFSKIHPATKTFQALRIEVNQELENLKSFIPQAIDNLAPGGKLAVISFHSLEDRIVKNIFRENARGCICPKSFPKCVCQREAKIKIITKKPIVPTDEEISNNPRSHSAKLRVCEKV